MELDRTHLRLLEILQKDARTPISELARILHRAESTVRERVASLERRGYLTGYHALVDPAKLGYRVHAVVRAECDTRTIPELARRLEGVPNFYRAYLTTGAKPLRIEILAEDLPHLERLVETHLVPLGIQELEVGLVVQDLLGDRQVPLRADDAVGSNGQPELHAVPQPD
jgi:DNA-binding Lrp family transcriptional regulator